MSAPALFANPLRSWSHADLRSGRPKRECLEPDPGFQCVSQDPAHKSVDISFKQFDSQLSRDSIRVIPMRKRTPPAPDHNQLYRERLRAAGCEEVLFKLPVEVVTLLDQLKQRQGLRNRSQALLQLIEPRRAAIQYMNKNAKARLGGRALHSARPRESASGKHTLPRNQALSQARRHSFSQPTGLCRF